MKKLLLIIFTLILAWQSEAAHLIGGELSYECIGGNNYTIKLQIYRDCFCTDCADFDTPAYITIFDGLNEIVDVLELQIDLGSEVENVPLPDVVCAETVPNVCVERSTGYETTVNLPPSTGGYKLVYQRCCRNNTITNILQPGATGSTYELEIPDPALAICNSSPTFNNFPPIVICAGYPLVFDNSATDIDGDELVYSLCTPFEGASQAAPYPPVASNPPYQEINWAFGFDLNNQIGGTPPMVIDPVTGLLEGFPDQIGQYVVGICVQEFRNGNLLSTSVRDFQFNITDCTIVEAGVESENITAQGEFILNDCGSYEVTFVNQSLGADTYWWDLGDPTNPGDQTNAENPTYLYPDTGVYEILLVANPGLPCTDTANIVLNLFPLLAPNFEYDADCSSQPVEFTDLTTSDFGTVTDYTWDFGDGNSSNDQSPNHNYAQGGNYNVSLTVFTDLGCEEVYEEEIYVLPTPSASYGNSLFCLDAQPINFTDESDINIGNIVNWDWDFGDMSTSTMQNPNHTYAGAGTYDISLTVTSDEGCIGEFEQTVTIYEVIETNAGIDEEICEGEEIQLVATTNINASTFEWTPTSPDIINNTSVQNPTVTPPAGTTTFTVVNTDPNGCEDIDEVNVQVFLAPVAEAGEADELCQGGSIQLNGSATDPNGGGLNLTYEWTPNTDIQNPTTLNPTVEPDVPTTYFLEVTETEHGCTALDSVQVSVVVPVVAEVMPDTLVCESNRFQLWASGGDTYSWEPAAPLTNPNSATPFAILTESTTFTVTVSNDCFSDVATVTIDVLPAPNVDAGPDFDLNIGETISLDGFSEYNYSWSPSESLSDPNIPNPIAQPLNSTTYLLVASSPNGCTAVDSARVEVTKIFKLIIPNAFSPNGDGRNDEIGLFTRGIRELEVFRIYNRWGQMVFETNDLLGTWDGRYKDQPQELGVFVYYAVGITYEGNEFFEKGNITLLR